jgi:hypothetical protein
MRGKKPNPYRGWTWENLGEQIAPQVLHAPKTAGEWPAVHERIVRYLASQVVGKPWANHLALIAAVLAARRQDVRTVEFAVRNLHVGLVGSFPLSDAKRARMGTLIRIYRATSKQKWCPQRATTPAFNSCANIPAPPRTSGIGSRPCLLISRTAIGALCFR